MEKYSIYYYYGSELLAKETKEFASMESAVSYVRRLENIIEINNKNGVTIVYKDKLTNVKITTRSGMEVLK